MTDNDKGLDSKAGVSLPPIAEPTPAPAPTVPLPVQPAPAALNPTAPAPAVPTGSTPTASPMTPPSAAHATHVGRRPRRQPAHHAPASTPAAPAPAADTEPEGSEETEQTLMTPAEAIAAAKEELRKEAAEKKEKRKLKNRAKRAPKAFLTWLGKWCKKHWFITAILVVAIIASLTMWVNGKFSDDAGSSASGSGIGESTVSKGIRPESGTRADQFFPKLSIDGANKVLTFEDPTAPTSLKMTFQVTVDEDNTITQVDLSDNMLKYGHVKFGTTNNSDDPAGYCKEKSCDFTDKPVNLCETWMFEQRQIPAAGGSEFAARFWSAREYDQATTDDSSSQVYPGDSGGNSRLCGGKY